MISVTTKESIYIYFALLKIADLDLTKKLDEALKQLENDRVLQKANCQGMRPES